MDEYLSVFTKSSNVLDHTVSEKTFDDLVVLVFPDEFLEICAAGMTIHVDQHTLDQGIVQFHENHLRSKLKKLVVYTTHAKS